MVLTFQCVREILAALEDAEKNEEVKFIILSAEGKILSVGGDLSEMKRAVDADDIESPCFNCRIS